MSHQDSQLTTTMDEHISTLLSSDAAKLSVAIFKVLANGHLKPSNPGYKAANNIAVRLHLIHTYLDSLPPYWMEPEVEHLCHSILRDLQAITQPSKDLTTSALHKSLPFLKSSVNQKSSLDPEKCLVTFFKMRLGNARSLNAACNDLLGELTEEENDTDEIPDSALQQVDIPSTSDDHNDAIFEALLQITQCGSTSYVANRAIISTELDSQTIRHPARLCLHDLPESQGSASHNILVLTSAIDMALWQEFCLKMYVYIYPLSQSRLHSVRKSIATTVSNDPTRQLFVTTGRLAVTI
jgi:hypothetical protein